MMSITLINPQPCEIAFVSALASFQLVRRQIIDTKEINKYIDTLKEKEKNQTASPEPTQSQERSFSTLK